MNNKIIPVAILDYTYNQKGKLNKAEVYSIHTDHLGTPKAITDQNQEVVWSIEMDTFGETKQIQSKDNFTFNLRFAGQYFDQETGYHYNYHRYYDPKVGGCLTSDPIGLNGGSLNTYTYVDNEVWNAIDPYGLMRIYMFPVNTGNGLKRTYEFHFATFWDRAKKVDMGFIDSILSKSKADKVSGPIEKAGQVGAWAARPTPYTSAHNDTKACMEFDKILEKEFRNMFPKKEPNSLKYEHRLTVEETRKFLTYMKNHKEHKTMMDYYYPETVQQIINIADKYGNEFHENYKKGGLGNLTNPDNRIDRYGEF